MIARNTRHLWVGWLDPSLRFKDDDGIAEDVSEFLQGLVVEQVVPERNGARIGAFVLLEEPIDKATFEGLAKRKYHGDWIISVDDAQPGNPKCAGKPCPRLCGPSKYCRGWNIRGHASWNWGCPFAHPEDLRPTFAVEAGLETIKPGSAKFDEIQTEMRRSMPHARIVKIQRSHNMVLEKMYDERRKFLHDKHGFTVEKELWHGLQWRRNSGMAQVSMQSLHCSSMACSHHPIAQPQMYVLLLERALHNSLQHRVSPLLIGTRLGQVPYVWPWRLFGRYRPKESSVCAEVQWFNLQHALVPSLSRQSLPY
jgi:hypothetical protein